MNLIANSGIQFLTANLDIKSGDNFKMYFHEWFDTEDVQLKLELAHCFSSDDVWVKKRDLKEYGYLDNKRVKESWDIIKTEISPIPIHNETPEGSGCFSMNLDKANIDGFTDKWLPLPFFIINNHGKSEFGPVNWCRFKILPTSEAKKESHVKSYNILLAFDTRTIYEEEGFEDEDFETPFFSNIYEKSKKYGLCKDEFMLIDFCSRNFNCEWVDEYILKLIHNTKNINSLKGSPKFKYLARYIYLINYIQQCNIFPEITLFSEKNVEWGKVDLILDIGNSQTCAVLFDEGDFTKVAPLELQNFSEMINGGGLNRYADPFDMRLVFREADFGKFGIAGSKQFIYPSFVRLGKEANKLIYQTKNKNTGLEKITTFSSPKRYLWDDKLSKTEWEFVQLDGEEPKSIWIDGISQLLNPDGSLNHEEEGGRETFYSRKSLMTFAFLEILAQAKMQINSYKYRNDWKKESTPRKIGQLIITCPTAMSRIEQIALRKCAQDASILLDHFFDMETHSLPKIVPSVKNLSNREERMEWTYDEATCSQFVFLYAEISKRYKNKSKEFFDLYGKNRTDLGEYHKKSVTIGSVDIGAGTTDLMICAYKQDNMEQATLTPVPLFWDSFYFAGDDLLKELVRQIIIEGPYSVVQNQLREMGKEDQSAALIYDFFGEDHTDMNMRKRKLRNDFNMQISVPLATFYLELLKNNVDKRIIGFDEIFKNKYPSQEVLNYFESHFGFNIKSVSWTYSKEIVASIVEKTFEPLVGKISSILAYCKCDFVLLSGRPTSLEALGNLFIKYYPVSPNRLITLNNYRVGRWYPFQDGNGKFVNQKSIVAIGAMIGNVASTQGSLTGFSLNLTELKDKLLPTSEYMGLLNNEYRRLGESFITPHINTATIEIPKLPVHIGCRQLETASYPARSLYVLDFNREKIEERMKNRYGDIDVNQIKESVENEIARIRMQMPLKVSVERDNYQSDKECLTIQSVENNNQDELPLPYFNLQIQSLKDSEYYWLDSGAFEELNINHKVN